MCFHAPCTKTVVPLAMGNNPCPLFNAYVGRFDLILIPLGDGIMLCHQQSLVTHAELADALVQRMHPLTEGGID